VGDTAGFDAGAGAVAGDGAGAGWAQAVAKSKTTNIREVVINNVCKLSLFI
jgi:hypothetical protein